MKNIEIRVLNPEAISECERMCVVAARLTQRGEKIKNIKDFMILYNKGFQPETFRTMVNLPHPTLQKFGVINVVIVGASRRFLAQITRHQNEVKFMSASLQYSDYSGEADFCVPYEIMEAGEKATERYLKNCEQIMDEYQFFAKQGVNNDACGYMAPQGLRNVLIISATPYQWKYMIQQRTCRRNTSETRYIMLRIWEQLYALSPILFENAGPKCIYEKCPEGKMSCGKKCSNDIHEILKGDFPLFYENRNY